MMILKKNIKELIYLIINSFMLEFHVILIIKLLKFEFLIIIQMKLKKNLQILNIILIFIMKKLREKKIKQKMLFKMMMDLIKILV